jgi:AraC-like DNA-binding protein
VFALGLSHAVIALLLVIALLAARDLRRSVQGRLLILLALSVAALELASGPDADLLWAPVRTTLQFAGAVNVALLWLFCLSLLRDDFRVRWPEWLGSALLVLGPLLVVLRLGGAVFGMFSALAPFVMVAHITWVALSERAGDLVGPRRSARFWIPLALVLAAVTSVLSEEVGAPAAASLIRNGLAGLPITIVLFWWLARFDPTRVQFEPVASGPSPTHRIDARDSALHADLLALVATGGLYRDPELTIEVLAARLKKPTHRLRALINGGLGFRNFAAFINGYRLTHAKTALADPQRARETILSIAFEAGFASLQTFNRVFRESEGLTPTAYRARALAGPAQNQKELRDF